MILLDSFGHFKPERDPQRAHGTASTASASVPERRTRGCFCAFEDMQLAFSMRDRLAPLVLVQKSDERGPVEFHCSGLVAVRLLVKVQGIEI